MTFQPGFAAYTQGFGTAPENVEVPHIENRAPTVSDSNYPIGKRWINQAGNAEFVLTSISTLGGVVSASWQVTASPSGAVSTINGLPPTAGNITIAGTANQIGIANAGSTVTLSLTGPYTPATYTAHGLLVGEGVGSIASVAVGATGTLLSGNTGADPTFTASPSVTGSVTAGTGVTATTGNIVAAAGNISATVGTINGGAGATFGGNVAISTGNLSLTTPGGKLNIASGANASVGTSAAMVAGTTTVSTTAVTASSIIFLTANTPGGVQGELSIGAITPATSFVINSNNAMDTSTVNWLIIN